MNKKILSVILAITLVLLSFCGCSAELFTGTSSLKYKVVDDHAEVTELPDGSADTEVIIEDEYEGVPVTVIRDFAGCNLESLEKIVIGKNVEEIGQWAFTNNSKLKAFEVDEENENFCSVDGVLFSKDMTTLLFYPNAKGTEYTIPDSVTEIRSKAFYKCTDLEKLTMPASLKKIGEKAFFRLDKLENITLPEGIEIIEKDAFGYCSAMTEITIPSSIQEIGDYAFYNCTSLLKVTVNAKEENITLGKDWQPTNNGLAIDELEITFA